MLHTARSASPPLGGMPTKSLECGLAINVRILSRSEAQYSEQRLHCMLLQCWLQGEARPRRRTARSNQLPLSLLHWNRVQFATNLWYTKGHIAMTRSCVCADRVVVAPPFKDIV